jgi:hypothetical protein
MILMENSKIRLKKNSKGGCQLIFRKKFFFYFIRYYYSITIVNKEKYNFMSQKVNTRILGEFFNT